MVIIATSPLGVFADRLMRYFSSILSNKMSFIGLRKRRKGIMGVCGNVRGTIETQLGFFCCARFFFFVFFFLEYFLWNAARGAVIKPELSEGVGGLFSALAVVLRLLRLGSQILNLWSGEERKKKDKRMKIERKRSRQYSPLLHHCQAIFFKEQI